MAARAGARMADMEFVQFHPTAINVGKDPAPLATEALRGHGATLHNGPANASCCRSTRCRTGAARCGGARHLCRGEGRSRRVSRLPHRGRQDLRRGVSDRYGYCQEAGIDPVTEPIPVIPAAHYFMGGIWTDIGRRTSLPGLWACGEVTSTGAHGANRLASNSLLEAVVFSARIAETLARRRSGRRPKAGRTAR
jgi:L-aspartate oxidase